MSEHFLLLLAFVVYLVGAWSTQSAGFPEHTKVYKIYAPGILILNSIRSESRGDTDE